MAMLSRFIQICILIGLSILAFICVKIFTHPGGGWGFEGLWTEYIALFFFLCAVFVPLLWFLRAIAKYQSPLIYGLSVASATLIVGFFGLALLEYGHGTPLFMLIGVSSSWGCWMVALRKAKASVITDRRSGTEHD